MVKGVMVPEVGLEPTWALSPLDFESSAYTDFATPAAKSQHDRGWERLASTARTGVVIEGRMKSCRAAVERRMIGAPQMTLRRTGYETRAGSTFYSLCNFITE